MKSFVSAVALFIFFHAGQAAAGSFDAATVVKNTDWSKMKTVTVSLGEYHFRPSGLTFEAGVPYKLVIKNDGKGKHYFVSEDFFRAIALRKVETSDGEIKTLYLTAVEVFPGKSLDLYFVPVNKGDSKLICTIKGHVEQGMVGRLVIE